MELVNEKRVHFLQLILSEENFRNNFCFISMYCILCIVYWINFQNIYTFTYQKTLLHTLLLLVFKIVESLQCILKACYQSLLLSETKIKTILWDLSFSLTVIMLEHGVIKRPACSFFDYIFETDWSDDTLENGYSRNFEEFFKKRYAWSLILIKLQLSIFVTNSHYMSPTLNFFLLKSTWNAKSEKKACSSNHHKTIVLHVWDQ